MKRILIAAAIAGTLAYLARKLDELADGAEETFLGRDSWT